MSYIDAAQRVPVFEVAQHRGQPVQKSRGASGGSCACPNPACAAVRRHCKRGDKRGAVGIRRDGLGWRCFTCNAAGDALDFVAYALAGCRLRDADADGRAKVRAWFEAEYGVASAPPAPRPAPAPAAPPNYPPAAEVRRLLERCVGVTA